MQDKENAELLSNETTYLSFRRNSCVLRRIYSIQRNGDN